MTNPEKKHIFQDGCLVGCFGFNGPLRSISVYIGPSPRESEKEKRKDRRRKHVQTIPSPPLRVPSASEVAPF